MGAADEGRFTRVYTEHYWAVVAYFRRRGSDPEGARDGAAEVFGTAWRRLADLPDDARPWLYGTARHVLANQQRAAARRHRLHLRLTATAEHAHSTPVEAPETRLAVLAALATLSAEDQEVLRLAAWEDLSPAQIGQVLGCSSGAAAVRCHRARQRLRAALARLGVNGEMEESRHG